MTDEAPDKITFFQCGPVSRKCEHDFSDWQDIVEGGEVVGGTAVCAKCGATAFDEACWS